jgi:hypothetical protein
MKINNEKVTLSNDKLLEALDKAIEDMYTLADNMYDFQETGIISEEQWDFFNSDEYEAIGTVLQLIKDNITLTKDGQLKSKRG